jgi:hypothetical protein
MTRLDSRERPSLLRPSNTLKTLCLAILMGTLLLSLPGCDDNDSAIKGYPIASDAQSTAQRMLSFPFTATSAPDVENLRLVSEYDSLGYGAWTYGSPLPIVEREGTRMKRQPETSSYSISSPSPTSTSPTRKRQIS